MAHPAIAAKTNHQKREKRSDGRDEADAVDDGLRAREAEELAQGRAEQAALIFTGDLSR